MRLRLIIAFLLVAFVPLTILVLVNHVSTRRALIQKQNELLLTAASRTAETVDQFVDRNLDAVRSEAKLPDLVRYLSMGSSQQENSPEERAALAVLKLLSLKNHIAISSYAVMDRKGRILLDTNGANMGKNRYRHPVFTRPMYTGLPNVTAVEFTEDAFDTAGLSFSAPVRDGNRQTVGVLSMRYRAVTLQRLVIGLNGLAGTDSFAVLFDENHVRMAHGTDHAQVFQPLVPWTSTRATSLKSMRRPPSSKKTTAYLPKLYNALQNIDRTPFFTLSLKEPQGPQMAIAATALDRLPWTVIFAQPQDSFLSSADAQLENALILAIIIVALVLAAAMIVSQALAQPIAQLTAVAQQVKEGDLQARAPERAYGEIGTLATAFNGMTHRLVKLIELLESRVAEAHRFRAVLDATSDFVAIAHQDGKMVYLNQAGRRLVEISSEEELSNTPFLDFYPELESEQIRTKNLPDAIKYGTWSGDTWLLSKDGREIPAHQVIIAHPSNEGSTEYFSTIARDTTERVEAAQALRTSEEKYRYLVETSSNLIWSLDAEGCWTFVSTRAAKTIYGRSPEEMIGQSFLECSVPNHIEPDREMLAKLKSGQSIFGYETMHRKKDGTEIHVVYNAASRYSASGQWIGASGTAADVTAQRRMENRVHEAQRFESLAVLAGGIAHDFNNLLVGILGNADLALLEVPKDSPIRSYLQDVIDTARRAADLSRQMLAYSGRGRFIVKNVSLTDLVQEMGRLLDVSISKTAKVVYHLDPDLPPVQADVTQLRQVIMNLITNASDAITNPEGTITLSTGKVFCDHTYLQATLFDLDLPEGEYVFLEVEDTGQGMDAATRSRIFDPFFTTKRTGRGLGLAATLGIVRGHKGTIKVFSEPGVGTSFRVLLPTATLTTDLAVMTTEKRRAAWSPHGTILVVDDEIHVQMVTRKILEKAGFEVVSARDGIEGVEMLRRRATDIQLVILDLTMPRMGGLQALKEMQQIREELAFLLTSGYSEQDVASQISKEEAIGFIQKPFDNEALLQQVRAALETP